MGIDNEQTQRHRQRALTGGMEEATRRLAHLGPNTVQSQLTIRRHKCFQRWSRPISVGGDEASGERSRRVCSIFCR